MSASDVSAPVSDVIATPPRISVSGPPAMPERRTTAPPPPNLRPSPARGKRERERSGQAAVDRDDRAEHGAAGDADQSGLGQGIAQIALQRRARKSECRTDQQTEQGARQADFAQNEAMRFAIGAAAPKQSRQAFGR